MTNIQNIQEILLRMTQLLRLGGRVDWADALDQFDSEIVSDPSTTIGRILSLYGGMGSLNDIILYNNGALLVNENNEFDTLKTQLYERCHASKLNLDAMQ